MKAVTVSLPDALYDQIKQRAAQSQRSVEAELLEVVTSAVPIASDLPLDLANAISPLIFLDDASLRRAARSGLSKRAFAKLENLHLKRQREGLNESETQDLEDLMRYYDRAVLVRAHAINLLKQRGHDISTLLNNK